MDESGDRAITDDSMADSRVEQVDAASLLQQKRCCEVELPVRRDLLDAQFQGYKLSLEELPSLRIATLAGAVGSEWGASQAQELTSLQHFRAFAVINGLSIDPWSAAAGDHFAVYYFNQQRQLVCHFVPSQPQASLPASSAGQIVGSFSDNAAVETTTTDAVPLCGSVQFADAQHCVVTNGRGRLFVHTGARHTHTGQEWTWGPVVDYVCPESCLLQTARTVVSGGAVSIHLVVLYVGKQAGKDASRFVTVLEWIVLQAVGSSWKTQRVRRLEGTSAPHYIAVEPPGDGLSLVGEGIFKIVFDSQRVVTDTATPADEVMEEQPPVDHAGLGKRSCFNTGLAAPDDMPSSFGPDDLEECDSFADETYNAAWMRFDGSTEAVSHRADLSGRQLLFTATVSPDQMPVMCIRYDVDGLVYQPIPPEAGSEKVPWEHIATFNALGYVVASKQEKKFAVCSTALRFACVCDGNRNVYLYRNEVPVGEQSVLKNRKTGQTISHVARQHVLTLNDAELPIVGLAATQQAVVILKKNALTLIYL